MAKHNAMKRFSLLRWSIMALWGLAVVLLTILPSHIPPMNVLTRWIGRAEVFGLAGHLFLFALLTLLLWQALRLGFSGRQALLLTMAAVLLLGTTTELFQWFVAGRMSTLIDLLANWLGAFAAAFLISIHLIPARS